MRKGSFIKFIAVFSEMNRVKFEHAIKYSVLGGFGVLSALVFLSRGHKGTLPAEERRARHMALYHRFPDQDIDESFIMEMQLLGRLGKELPPYPGVDIMPYLQGSTLEDYFKAAEEVIHIPFSVDQEIYCEPFDPQFGPPDRDKTWDFYASLDTVLRASRLHADLVQKKDRYYIDIWSQLKE